MAGDKEFERFDLGTPGAESDYDLGPRDPEPDLSAVAEYGDDPDAMRGASTDDDGTILQGGPEDILDLEETADQHLPKSELAKDDALHHGGGRDSTKDGPADDAKQGSTEGNGRKSTVIDVVFEQPRTPSRERLALMASRDRVYAVARSNKLPPSVIHKLQEPSDAVTLAVVTKLAVAKIDERTQAEQAKAAPDDTARDADLVARGKEDPAHLRDEIRRSGPGKFVDALAKVDIEKDVWDPITKPKGFAKKLEEADPDAFLRTVESRTVNQFFRGEAVGKGWKPSEDSPRPEYIGLLLDPAIVGRTVRKGREFMKGEGSKLDNLMHLCAGEARMAGTAESIQNVRSYINHLNSTEARWMNIHGRGNPGNPDQTVSPHHADRLEWFLSFARPLLQGEPGNPNEVAIQADQFTAETVREMVEARIGYRRQAQYMRDPQAYADGKRVAALSDEDYADLALAARFDERVANHEQVPDSKSAETIMKCWDDVIAREDRLYQAALKQKYPGLFKPGVAPPVSPRHLTERFEQVGYKFRMRLADQMEGPDPNLRGRAAANTGLVADMEEYMGERARVREELRLATSANPAAFMAGNRPDELSPEEISDWARLTAIKVDVAIQPEFMDTGSETADTVLVTELSRITQREASLIQAAAHAQDRSRLYQGHLPPISPREARGMIEVATMTARTRIQGGGLQTGHEFIAEVTKVMQRLFEGRVRYAEHGGDLSQILTGEINSDHLNGLPDDTLAVLRDAAAAKVEEQIAAKIRPDPDDVRRLQVLQGELHASEYDRSGQVSDLRTSAALASAQQTLQSKNKPDNAVHIIAGPGPENPDLLVAITAGFGVFDQISIEGTRKISDELRIASGKDISPVANRDLVVRSPGYRSAETLIIQGKATAAVDPYDILGDKAVKNIIIQDAPNPEVINEILMLINDQDPDAPFSGHFVVDPMMTVRTGWADLATFEVDMGDEEDARMTVLFRRVKAA